MRSAAVFALGLSLFLASACSRTPLEPTATDAPLAVPPMPLAATVPATPPARSSHPAGRCIKPLPATAPEIPPPASDGACPRDPSGAGTLPTTPISFPDTFPALKIDAELAKTPDTIERGLMYRRSMSDSSGMLFKLDDHRDHTFWMHNTCIALDMMFVDTDGLIVGIVEGAAPLTDGIRSVGCASAYVLEVNGGWSRKHNVTPGQRITIPL